MTPFSENFKHLAVNDQHSIVMQRMAHQPQLMPIMQALMAQPNWDTALLNTQIQALNPNLNLNLNLNDWHTALRQLRWAGVAALAQLDSVPPIALSTVMHNMSLWADWALQQAVVLVGQSLALRYGVPIDSNTEQGIDLHVVAMGKLGGYELNVSSDIDLVFLATSLTGETAGVPVQGLLRRCSNGEFLQQWAKGVVAFLSAVTTDGFVFRVDTMLRPHGSAGPLVMEHAMLEAYLLSEGRMWERLAWLKARPVITPCFMALAEHQAGHQAWQMIVAPFVYRRYLDFTVLDSLRELHQRIRQERRMIEANAYQGLHLKLARGGIRELEFWVQGQQLIRAGRDPSLRGKDTLSTLAALVQAGMVTPLLGEQMTQYYTTLRRAEHGVQYVDDAQTHLLPVCRKARERLAQRQGFSTLVAFDEHLAKTMIGVATQFDALFASSATPAGSEDTLDTLALTVPHIQAAFASVAVWAGVSDSSRLTVLALLERCAALSENVFERLLQFIKSISRRKTYLDILLTHPPAFIRLQTLMAATPFAAQYLQAHPALLDELIDGVALQAPMNEVYWETESLRLLTRLRELDEETQLHVLCEAHHSWVLRILVQDKAQGMGGGLDVRAVSDALSQAADLILNATLCCVNQAFTGDFAIPCGLAVIAYGKLGGKELGYGSDLDVVFIYEPNLAGALAGQYARWVQRVISWLSVQTAAGRLFEMDTALRPNGQSGLILSCLDAFTEYQLGHAAGTHAWLWEHQALSRARLCAGDARLTLAFNAVREQVLGLPRPEAMLKEQVIVMRQRIAQEAANQVPSGYFDVKHSVGGMVDIEFAVQYAVLRYSADHAVLRGNIGNVGLLNAMAEIGLIKPDLAQDIGASYMALRQLQHGCKLQSWSRAMVTHTQLQAFSHFQAINIIAVQELWVLLGLQVG